MSRKPRILCAPIRVFLPIGGYRTGRTADVQETADSARSPSAFSCQSAVIVTDGGGRTADVQETADTAYSYPRFPANLRFSDGENRG